MQQLRKIQNKEAIRYLSINPTSCRPVVALRPFRPSSGIHEIILITFDVQMESHKRKEILHTRIYVKKVKNVAIKNPITNEPSQKYKFNGG